ncbi:MAG: hypothetical protein OHK0039_28230 [Bacteroidia bacterium]
MTLTRDFSFLYLYDLLGEHLEAAGFLLLEGKNQFRRSHTQGFENVILSVSVYPDLAMVDFHLGLRLESIEQIGQRFSRTLPGFYPDAHTLITSYGNLTSQPYFRFKAANAHDLDLVAETFMAFWDERGLAFLDRHRHLAQVEHTLNALPSQPSPYLHNQAHRYIKGLVAAHLMGRADFAELAREYEVFLGQVPGGQVFAQDFRELVRYLAGRQ